jgi:hypothetical protein
MKLLDKIKKWIRTNYLKLRYKLNWNTGNVILLKQNDRRMGLTTIMFGDCLANDYKLYVPNQEIKKAIIYNLYITNNVHGLFKDDEFNSTRSAYNKYISMFICPNDIRHGEYKGKGLIKVIIDNSCGIEALQVLYDAEFYSTDIEIINGFVYAPYLKF